MIFCQLPGTLRRLANLNVHRLSKRESIFSLYVAFSDFMLSRRFRDVIAYN